jgi:hypothetical protein
MACADRIDPQAPRPTLSVSAPAGESFASVRARWAHASSTERVELEPRLRELRTRYPADPLVRLADLYLAWIALERGDATGAEAAAKRVAAPAPGNDRDIANLVRGAAIGRQGRDDEAVDVLLPLLGRLLDPFARELLHEELVRAGLASHRWADTVRALDAWQHDQPRDADGTVILDPSDDRIERALERVPGTALEASLERYRDEDRLDDPFARKLSARLAGIAVARGDSTLAQRLVQRQSDLAGLGTQRETLLELASTRQGARIAGRTVGLVLSVDDDHARARAASISFGAERASAPPPALPLVALSLSASDPATTDNASLRAFLRRGAIALVGGDTPAAATTLARFAEENEVPAVLFAMPLPSPEPLRWSFVSAPIDDGTASLMVALRDAGASKIARIGRADGSPDRLAPPLPAAGGASEAQAPCPDFTRSVQGQFPIEAWRKLGVDAIVLAEDEGCAARALDALRRGSFHPRIGFTLDTVGASTAVPSVDSSTRWAATLDGFPVFAPPSSASASSGSPSQDTQAPPLRAPPPADGVQRALAETGRRRVEVWSFRAFLLFSELHVALRALPDDETEDEELVRERRRQARGIIQTLLPSNGTRNVVTARVIPPTRPTAAGPSGVTGRSPNLRQLRLVPAVGVGASTATSRPQ